MFLRFLSFFLFIILSSFSFVWSQSGTIDSVGTGSNLETVCISDKYDLVGDFSLKLNSVAEISVKQKGEINFNDIKSVKFELFSNDKLIEDTQRMKYSHKFINPGTFKLKSTVIDNAGCEYILTKDFKVYKELVLYVGSDIDGFNLGFDKSFDSNNILFKKIILSDGTLSSDSEFYEQFSNNSYGFKNADIVIIYSNNFTSILESLGKFARYYGVDISEKKFVLVETLNKNFFRTIIPRYIKLVGLNDVYILGETNFLNFMSDVSFGKTLQSLNYLSVFTLSLNDISKAYFMSYIIDYLVYNNFPTYIIGYMLTLSVCVLVVSIFRQFIGFSVFGVYNPILFALCMALIGIKISFVLLFVSFLSTYVSKFISSKIFMLYSAKISLNILFYFFFLLLVLWVDAFFDFHLIDFTLFSNGIFIFAFFVMIIVSSKILDDGFNFFSTGWWFSFGEFLFVTYTVYLLVSWLNFQYFLLSYPSSLLFIIVLNVIVGRFTGLQLLEYFRFIPLIRKHFEEEE